MLGDGSDGRYVRGSGMRLRFCFVTMLPSLGALYRVRQISASLLLMVTPCIIFSGR